MNLDTSFIIGKGRINESYERFIEASGFIGPVPNGECKLFDIPNLGENKIAIGECNGFVFIGHHEIPLWFNDEELSSREYHQFNKKITQTFKKGRFISGVFISKITAFGYAIYDHGDLQRKVLGKYDVLMENEGSIQVEETLISKRPDQSDTVYTFQGEDVELHKIGTQVTIDVLNKRSCYIYRISTRCNTISYDLPNLLNVLLLLHRLIRRDG